MKGWRWQGSGDSDFVDPGRGDGRAQPGAVAQVNVETGQRLQVTRVLQAAGVHRGKAQALGQRGHSGLGGRAVAGDEHAGGLAVAEIGTSGQHLGEQGVEGLDDQRVGHSLGNLFGGRGTVARVRPM